MPLPYAPLTPAPPYARMRRKGWQVGKAPAIPIELPIDWSLALTQDRSWVFHFLSLDMIDPLLVEHAGSGAVQPLQAALDIALDWWKTLDGAEDQAVQWYDMATGLRAWRFSYVIAAGEAAGLAAADLDTLRDSLAEHERRLIPEDRFTATSNHGFFQAAGLLSVERGGLSRESGARGLAARRLRMIVDTHFSREGVHKEHSPDYHYFLHRGFQAVRVRWEVEDAVLARRLDDVATTLAWFLDSEGRVVNFGDSDNRPIPPEEQAGLPPTQAGLKVFSEGGYAVLRTRTEPPAYLAQTLCYHSRVHKQADDLAIVWQARGVDVLVDAGRLRYGALLPRKSPLHRLGYRYADPQRIYCESLTAHNTLEIAGARDCRQDEPYGSALLDRGQSGDVVAVLSRVERRPYAHTRLIVGDGANWLVVVDGVGGGLLRPTTRQWFHLGPTWTAEKTETGMTAQDGPRRLVVDGLTPGAFEGPWLGQTEPHLQGWWSPKGNRFDPAPAFAVAATTRTTATSLTFSDFGSTTGNISMNGRLEGRLNLTLGDGRLVVISVAGAGLALKVQGTRT